MAIIIKFEEQKAKKIDRDKRPWSLRAIEKVTGVSRNSLSRWQRKKPRARIELDVLEALCRFFECQPGDLIKMVDD